MPAPKPSVRALVARWVVLRAQPIIPDPAYGDRSPGYDILRASDGEAIGWVERTYGDRQDPWRVSVLGQHPHEVLRLDDAAAEAMRVAFPEERWWDGPTAEKNFQ